MPDANDPIIRLEPRLLGYVARVYDGDAVVARFPQGGGSYPDIDRALNDLMCERGYERVRLDGPQWRQRWFERKVAERRELQRAQSA